MRAFMGVCHRGSSFLDASQKLPSYPISYNYPQGFTAGNAALGTNQLALLLGSLHPAFLVFLRNSFLCYFGFIALCAFQAMPEITFENSSLIFVLLFQMLLWWWWCCCSSLRWKYLTLQPLKVNVTFSVCLSQLYINLLFISMHSGFEESLRLFKLSQCSLRTSSFRGDSGMDTGCSCTGLFCQCEPASFPLLVLCCYNLGFCWMAILDHNSYCLG